MNTVAGTCVTLNSTGQIIVGGYSDQGSLIARYNTDGSLDTTFGSTAGVNEFPEYYCENMMFMGSPLQI